MVGVEIRFVGECRCVAMQQLVGDGLVDETKMLDVDALPFGVLKLNNPYRPPAVAVKK